MLNVPGVMGIVGKLEVPVRRSVQCKYNRLCLDKILMILVILMI